MQILQGTDAERTVRNFLTISCIASIYVIRLVRVGMVDFTWVEGGISLSLVLLTLWMIASRSHAWQTERNALIQNLETTTEALAEPKAQAFKATSRLTDLGLLHRCSANTMAAANRADIYRVLHERFAAGSMTWMQVNDAWIPTESLEAFTDILARTCDPMELQWEVETTREQDRGALHLRFEINYWADTLKRAVYAPPNAELDPELEDTAWWQLLLGQALHRMVDQGWETRVAKNVLKLTYRFELTSDQASSGPLEGSTRHLYTPDFARKFPTRILVAEDNPVNQKLVVFMLEKLGCNLTLAQDGQEAIDLANQQGFDLIFMDLHMPNADGVEAAKRILATGQTPTIVPLTANVSDTSRQACAEAGMTGFIAKPFAIGQLCQAIEAAYKAR